MALNVQQQRTPGPNCILAADGAHLCGPAGLHKRSNGNIRREMRERWEEALRRADLMRGECVRDADGRLLSCTCEVYTIAHVWQARGHGETVRRGFADFGHIVADTIGGAYCGGNALPEDNEENERHGEHPPHVAPGWPLDHFRAAWREVALERMTATKRRRAV